MPYKSDAQRKLFHAKLNRGEISQATVDEWDKASKGKSLPEHVKKSDDERKAPAKKKKGKDVSIWNGGEGTDYTLGAKAAFDVFGLDKSAAFAPGLQQRMMQSHMMADAARNAPRAGMPAPQLAPALTHTFGREVPLQHDPSSAPLELAGPTPAVRRGAAPMGGRIGMASDGNLGDNSHVVPGHPAQSGTGETHVPDDFDAFYKSPAIVDLQKKLFPDNLGRWDHPKIDNAVLEMLMHHKAANLVMGMPSDSQMRTTGPTWGATQNTDMSRPLSEPRKSGLAGLPGGKLAEYYGVKSALAIGNIVKPVANLVKNVPGPAGAIAGGVSGFMQGMADGKGVANTLGKTAVGAGSGLLGPLGNIAASTVGNAAVDKLAPGGSMPSPMQ